MNKKLKNIILIGPVFPYKGGISHYTSLLYHSLKKEYNVEMISYKLQYPKLLFKKDQKDYQNDHFKIDETQFIINTANPFNWIKVVNKLNKMSADLVVFQWWHPYFAPCYHFISKRIKNKKILFTCHNVFPHERFPFDRFLSKITLRQSDYFITQSTLDSEDLLSIIPNAKYSQTVHPTYNAFKFTEKTTKEARNIININENEKVILFFGFVREYKGLKHLLNAMPIILEKFKDIKLLIVGDFGSDKQIYYDQISSLNIDDKIKIVSEYVPDNEVENYFYASDLVALPYESATQSGIVQIAYGFEKPVIVTNVGGLPDVVIEGKTGHVVKPFDEKSLATAVIKYFDDNESEKFISGIKDEAYKYSWDNMNLIIRDLYEK